jgi:hypothetical protein
MNRRCNYCKKNPGADPNNENLWNGFFDGDTKQTVCSNCRDRHYKSKFKKHEQTYTEFPLPLNNLMPFEVKRK